ncbi:hypothetical protein ABZP36_027198 [Zizania latifolia]
MEVAEGRTVVAATAAAGGSGGAGAGVGLGGGARSELEGLPCPRCESTHTKFCYYNNYNLAQPRHFCKGCRRYWTRGGALRNVPVGGGTRKATPACRRKRAAPTQAAPSHCPVPAPAPAAPAPVTVSSPLPLLPPPYEMPFLPAPLTAIDPDHRLLDLGGSFTSLLTPAPLPNGSFATGFLLGGMAPPPAPSPSPAPLAQLPQTHPPRPPVSQPVPEGIWAIGWPHLSI